MDEVDDGGARVNGLAVAIGWLESEESGGASHRRGTTPWRGPCACAMSVCCVLGLGVLLCGFCPSCLQVFKYQGTRVLSGLREDADC